MNGSGAPSSGARRSRPWRAVWALLLLDLAAAPMLYQLWRDVRGDVAEAALRRCTGDCDDNGQVGVGELLTGTAIALADVPLDTCGAFDVTDPGRVTVDELVRAVVDSLGPCRYPYATPTTTAYTITPISNARVRRTPPPP